MGKVHVQVQDDKSLQTISIMNNRTATQKTQWSVVVVVAQWSLLTPEDSSLNPVIGKEQIFVLLCRYNNREDVLLDSKVYFLLTHN